MHASTHANDVCGSARITLYLLKSLDGIQKNVGEAGSSKFLQTFFVQKKSCPGQFLQFAHIWPLVYGCKLPLRNEYE